MEQQIKEWKEQFGEIYKSEIGEHTVYWKKVKRKEYVQLMTQEEKIGQSMYDTEEEIVKLCVLYPDNVEEIIDEDGGFATALSDHIMQRSGFTIKTTKM